MYTIGAKILKTAFIQADDYSLKIPIVSDQITAVHEVFISCHKLRHLFVLTQPNSLPLLTAY